MEQRRLRLGDTLDDYCPRERRVTNHAVVAMVEDTVKQTRCTTCDAEHEYKGARVPRRRKKETPSALFKEVLAGKPDEAPAVLAAPAPPLPDAAVPAPAVAVEADPAVALSIPMPEPRPEPAPRVERPTVPAVPATVIEEPATPVVKEEERQPSDDPRPHPSEEWPMHRPLIRATLPRADGQKEERRPTDFTIRQPLGGRSGFRGESRPKFRGHAGADGNGNRTHGTSRGGARPAGGRGQAGRSGPSAGFRGGPPRHGGGKKRSR